MRTIIFLFPFLLLFFSRPALAQEGASPMDEMATFERSEGSERVAIANSFMGKLYQAEFIDQVRRYDANTPLDSIFKQVYFAATEYAFYELVDYDRAIHYGLEALKVMKRVKDLDLEGACENMLAIAYFRQSNFVKALEHARCDLAIQRRFQNASSISSALNTIAGIYLASRNEEEALDYVSQAMEFSILAKDSSRLAIQKGMASEILFNQKRYQEALDCVREAYVLDSLRGNRPKMGIRLSQQASPLMRLQRYDEAEQILVRAIAILKEYKIGVSVAICQNQLGYIANLKQRYAEAASVFHQALDYFVAHHDLYNESKARSGLSVALREQNPSEALMHMERLAVLKDSLYDREMRDALSRAHAEYKNEQLVLENEHHRVEKRLLVIAGIAVSFLVLIVFTYLLFLLRKYRQKLAEDKMLTEEVIAMDAEVVLNKEEESLIRKVNEYVDLHMADSIEVGALAASLSMSRKQLNRKLSQIMKCNVSTYVIRRRMDHACNLLLNSNNRVSDVAFSCGFDNPSNFARTFKDVKGCSPSVFRKEHLVK